MSEIPRRQEISGYLQASLLDLEGGNYDGDLDELYMIEFLLTQNEAMYEALKEFVDCFSDETGYSNPSYEGVNRAIDALALADGDKP